MYDQTRMESGTSGDIFFVIICAVAAVNALFLAVYVWSRRNRNLVPNLLVTLFLVLSVYRIIHLVIHHLSEIVQLPGWAVTLHELRVPTILLLGPLVYFYFKAVISKDFQFRTIDLLHPLPFLVITVIHIIQAGRIDQLDPAMAYGEILLIRLHFLAYLVFAYRIYRSFRIRPDMAEQSAADFNPAWLRNVWHLFFGLWFVTTFIYITGLLFGYLPILFLEPLSYALIIYLMGYLEIRSHKITEMTNFQTRYKGSSLTTEAALAYLEQLKAFMDEAGPWKDPDLSLVSLAKKMSLTPHLLSQVINEQMNLNFNDFINSYRVKEAQKLLLDPAQDNYTIASIAYDSGFNTLSAFNSAFKKFTGTTPSQFRGKNQPA